MKTPLLNTYGKRFQVTDGPFADSWHYPDPTGTCPVLLVRVGTPTTTGCTREEAQAALRLVDAAPELLAACRQYLASVETAVRIYGDQTPATAGMIAAAVAARAAIAKAEGAR